MAHHKYASHHIFNRVCDEHKIEHQLTKVRHPWANGQVERMNRTIKEATVKRYHYDGYRQLEAHLHVLAALLRAALRVIDATITADV